MSDGNNTRLTADDITVPGIINDQVSFTDRDDWFTFTLPENTVISIGLFGHSVDLDLFVFQGAQQIAASVDPVDSPELVTFTALANQPYFIRVNAFDEAGDSYELVFIEGAPATSRTIERISTNDVSFTSDTLPFFSTERWVPGQTLGYNIENLLVESQRAAAIRTFDQLTRTINLDFIEDQFGVFNIQTNDNLGDRILGTAELVDEPFNSIRIISEGRTDVVVHEIGHSFGLEHPIAVGNGDPAIHGLPFTIMRATAQAVADGQSFAYRTLNPTGLLVLDLEYLVEVYGSDPDNLGNNSYVFDTSVAYFEGFHDGGGIDTITIIDDALIGVRLDLNPRGASNFGAFRTSNRLGTVFNTRYTILEHAVLADGADTVTGSEVDNHIIGMGGDDLLSGRNGNDTLEAGKGDDSLSGGNGEDLLIAGSGADTLTGGSGADQFEINVEALLDNGGQTIVTDLGADDQILVTGTINEALEIRSASTGTAVETAVEIIGATSGIVFALVRGQTSEAVQNQTRFQTTSTEPNPADLITGTSDDDVVDADIGDDTVNAGAGDDTISGGDGEDLLRGQAGNDQLFGGNGGDTLTGGSGADLVSSGAGNDRLLGGPGNDTLFGAGGVDILIGGAGADILDGGGGNADFATYSTAGSAVDLILQIGSAPFDPVGTISALGDAEGDQLVNIEQLAASQFNDRIQLSGTLETPTPTVRFFGLGGDDTLLLNPQSATPDALLNTVVQGGTGDDVISVSKGQTVRVFGQAGDDRIDVDAINILVRGGGGNDSISLNPTAKPTAVSVNGQSGDDLITGSRFDDVLIGSAGDDTLITSGGSDTLSGGGGDDLFIISTDTAEGGIIITDFRPGDDTLELQGAADFDTVLTNAQQQGGDVLIDLSGRTILLEGIELDQLTPTNLMIPSAAG